MKRRFGPAGVALFLWIGQPFTPMLFGGYWVLGIAVVPLLTLLGTSMWNNQDWVRESWRDEENEERVKWDKEDIDWAAYENALKTWLEGQQRIQEMTPLSSSQHPADITLEARAAADALRRSS
jgi:hypothetical protein